MPQDLTLEMVNDDPRFALANKCLRAIFPGAVIIAKFPDDAPRLEDGTLAPQAKPQRLEIAFMPPPGLDFDSRHPLFGAMELVEVARDAKASTWKDFAEALEAWQQANPGERLSGDTGALADAITAAKRAAELEAAFDADDGVTPGERGEPGALAKPTSTDVFFAKRDADAAAAHALAVLRVEEAHCLAPPKDTRDEVAAAVAAATGDRPGVPAGREGDPVPDAGSPGPVSESPDQGPEARG